MRKPSDGLSLRGHRAALILVCAGVWLHAADSLLVATMLPALVAEIGGEALIGWTVSLYEIGTILTGAASGLLAARYGVRLPMTIAAAAFAAGCAISALAPSMWVVL
ncbi:MAG: MFS transporter, partial [Rhodospirillaceae bacterium]|nr:MFS transporter [Rhodospirillaceae bacterium]